MDINVNPNRITAVMHTVPLDPVAAPAPEPVAAVDLQTAVTASEDVQWDQSQPLENGQLTVNENPQGRIAYPWNPADPAADAFFEQAEQAAELEAWQLAEIAARATTFFAQADRLWATAAAPTPIPTPLQNKLAQKFARRIPENLLAAIAQQAQSVVSSSLSLADQLVQCVADVLPTFAADDLHVLARPLAYAMRGEAEVTPWDAVLQNVRPVNWEALSEVEQARISLAIARYAIAESAPIPHS